MSGVVYGQLVDNIMLCQGTNVVRCREVLVETYATNLRFELKKNGYTLAGVARKVGVSKSLVSKILKQQRKNEDVELFLASVLGVKADRLWHLEFRDALVSTEHVRKEGDQRKVS